jgi:hypothetical protein
MSLALQSLASSSPSACDASDGAVHRRKDNEARTDGSERAQGAQAPKGRHALLAALTEALGALGAAPGDDTASAASDELSPSTSESKHALHAFVHELFSALRPAESEGRSGRGFAWGRTSSADLAQRLDALVQSLQAGTAKTPRELPADASTAAIAPTPAIAPTTSSEAVAVPAKETPEAGPPLAPARDASTTSTTAVHVDPLLSAFRELLAARHPVDASGASGDGVDALVDFLQRMSQSLEGDAASGSPTPGTLLDVTA